METADLTTIECDASVEQLEGELIARLPADASAALPSRGQVAMEGTLNGSPFATVVEPDGRRGHFLVLGALSIEAGATVSLALAPAPQWPEPSVPQDLAHALDGAPDLAQLWQSITPMARWEWVRWVQSTRNADTRARRVEVAIDKLRGGKRRPCCFDLASCTVPQLARSGKLIEPPAADARR